LILSEMQTDMDRRTPIFLDTEFTGLNQSAQLISIALVRDDGHWFYAEFTDYDAGLLSEWHRRNVTPHLYFNGKQAPPEAPDGCVMMQGDAAEITAALRPWLDALGPVEIWADVPAFDWVLFCELFGGALNLPGNIFYIPFDFATLLRVFRLDPDADRLALSGLPADTPRHNALADARMLAHAFPLLTEKQLASEKKD
jgi:hypothetical protein